MGNASWARGMLLQTRHGCTTEICDHGGVDALPSKVVHPEPVENLHVCVDMSCLGPWLQAESPFAKVEISKIIKNELLRVIMQGCIVRGHARGSQASQSTRNTYVHPGTIRCNISACLRLTAVGMADTFATLRLEGLDL